MRSLLLLSFALLSVHAYIGYGAFPNSAMIRGPGPIIRNDEFTRKSLIDKFMEKYRGMVGESSEESDDDVKLRSDEVIEEAQMECDKGNYMNSMTKECEECTPCKEGQYVTSGCVGTEDAVCGSCDIADPDSDSFWYSCEHTFDGKTIRLKDWKQGFTKDGGAAARIEDSYDFFELFEKYLRKMLLSGKPLTDDERRQLTLFDDDNLPKVFTMTDDDEQVALDDPKWKEARIEDYALLDSREVDEYSEDPFETFRGIRRQKFDEHLDSFEVEEEKFEEESNEDDEDVLFKTLNFNLSDEDSESESEEDDVVIKKKKEFFAPMDDFMFQDDLGENKGLIREMLRLRPHRKIVVIGAPEDGLTTTTTIFTPQEIPQIEKETSSLTLKNAIIICCIAFIVAILYQIVLLPCLRRRRNLTLLVPPMCAQHQNMINSTYERLKDEKALPTEV